MQLSRFLILVLMAASLLAVTIPAISAEKRMDARAVKAYGKLPLSIVENKGQLDKRVRYVIRGPRASAFFRNDGITFDLWEASKRDRLDRRGCLGEDECSPPSEPANDEIDRTTPEYWGFSCAKQDSAISCDDGHPMGTRVTRGTMMARSCA